MGKPSELVHRTDILSSLVASFLQGGDRPTLMALAVAFGVNQQFIAECRRLQDQRTIALEPGGESS